MMSGPWSLIATSAKGGVGEAIWTVSALLKTPGTAWFVV